MKINKIGIQTGSKYPIGITDSHIERIRNAVPEAHLYVAADMTDIMQMTEDMDILIAAPDALDADGAVEYLLNVPDLKYIQSWTSGTEAWLNSEPVRKRSIRVAGARGVQSPALADHVISLIYYYMRGLNVIMDARKKKDWKAGWNASVTEAACNTVGVVGLGNIGSVIAMKLHALGFRVFAAKRHPDKRDYVDQCFAMNQLNEMIPECDYIVLICPLVSETENLFALHQFNLMKKSAYLINVGRGALIDEDALIQALETERIAGAALDVFRTEPLPVSHPFWEHDKIFLSFHEAAKSPLSLERLVDMIADNIKRYSAGEELLFEDTRKRSSDGGSFRGL